MTTPYTLDRHGRLAFPCNAFPEISVAGFATEGELRSVIARDFEAKAPAPDEIIAGTARRHAGRYDLLRDLSLHVLWADRDALALYDKRVMRLRDVPRGRDDAFLPAHDPWPEAGATAARIAASAAALPARWDEAAEDRIGELLLGAFASRLHDASRLDIRKPLARDTLARPGARVYRVGEDAVDHPVFSYDEILDCREGRPEIEALMRLAMVLHNRYPWDAAAARLVPVRDLADDDLLVLYVPRDRAAGEYLRRLRRGEMPAPAPPARPSSPDVLRVPPIVVADRFEVMPRLASLAVATGEDLCTNDDIIRNAGFHWSPMDADDIVRKTGITSRAYSRRPLAHLALDAAAAAVDGSGRDAGEFAAVIVCSSTSGQLMPSIAAWLSARLGMHQTHASFDLLAACAGFPYGVAEAVRLLQDVRRPVLVVCADKFSDRIGSVRTSRMIFGDGAAAFVVVPAPAGDPGDVDVVQTYASGPPAEVDSIVLPNADFNDDVTVWGPEVKALVARYLDQMAGELAALPAPAGERGTMADAIDLTVPHQANRTMVADLASRAGFAGDRIYFNIGHVGNLSAASIPVAIHDAVAEGVIARPRRVFAPGFGAGAAAGYAVVRIDPAIVATGDARSTATAGALGA